MRYISLLITLLLIQLAFSDASVAAQQEPFYKGKTIRIISWPTPGGATDVAARLYARHLPKFIPGNPKVIVQVMPGAGGLVAANYMYRIAEPDGLTLWINEPPLAITQLASGKGIHYDMLKYVYLGAIARQTQLALVRGTLPYDTIDKAMKAKEPLVATARRVGSSDYVGAKALEALGVPIKIVTGYRGSAEELTALERGEADLFITSLSGVQALRPEWLEPKPGVIHHIAAFGYDRPEVAHVPNIRELKPLPGKEGFVRLADFLSSTPRRILSAPPGTPPAIEAQLKESFGRMVKDEDFLEEAKRAQVEVSPVAGDTVEKMMEAFVSDETVKRTAPEFMRKK